MVSLSAPVSRDRNASRTTLYPYTRIDDDSARGWLADQWEITSRERLVRRLDDLSRGGYRARAQQVLGVSPLAWDAALYVDIARLGFGCGMVTEAEAWTALKNIVPSVVRTYGSWQEYADHYLLGRKVWRDGLSGTRDTDIPAPQAAADAHLSALLDPASRSSPWNLAPWDTITHPDRAR
ncbi:DUF1266 domain-containing protein [Streptomyces sp. NBC_00201]|uniref:DUF1266 domain-containing protein n=1 Tax=unclassified Streptomyces TaxID=2593676 RepID=UPI0022576055|nr:MULTISPECIES: DUF1266 domain-containing protein [unclassified Streptomyces]MCX5048023.1 DUF1266 domain-containing protein [Streptomyces sp. NBC_00474]MCX5245873.1 DUF1266 domain-containing protein [Streptomyces sp. NBC_00201]